MNKNSQKGFTVVELVVTIVIAGIIIPAVAVAMNNLSALNHSARDLALANTLAQNKAETLRSVGYNAVGAGTVSFTSEMPSSMGAPKSASYTVADDTPSTGVKQVDINISYTEYNATKNVSYRTYISELGVGQ